MIDVHVGTHRVHPWQSGDGLWVRGWFFHADAFFEGPEAHAHLVARKQDLASVLPELIGAFAIISSDGEQAWVAVDRVRTFPLVVATVGHSRLVTDRIEDVPGVEAKASMDRDSVREYLATGYVTGPRTLYPDVTQVEAGQTLTIGPGGDQRHDYYLHEHVEGTADVADQLARLDETVQRVFGRLTTSLRGRQVVLLLSGGYDSRLVAVNLRRAGYDNVVCVSFGTENTREHQVAKEVAEGLGYPWHMLDIPDGWLRERFDSQKFSTFIRDAGGGVSTPYYMGLLVERAVDAGIVDRDAVVVTGNSGDLVEGKQMTASLVAAESSSMEEVVDAIVSRHYMLWGKSYGDQPEFRQRVKDSLRDERLRLNRAEALDVEERFNWRERQSKYVVQDARCYDELLGMDWRFPLWDFEFMDYWLQVPVALRADRWIYMKYVSGENFRSANVRTRKHRAAAFVKEKSKLLTNALYPVEKLRHFLRSRDPYYVVNLREFLTVLRLTGGYRITTITTHLYRELRDTYRLRLPVDDPHELMRP